MTVSVGRCLKRKTKWFWVRVQLQSLHLQISGLLRARSSLTFRQLWSVDSLWNAYVTWQEHTVIKGELRPKFHPCFIYIFLLIFCRRTFNKVSRHFDHFFTKLWSCIVLNLTKVTSFLRLHITYHPYFLANFVNLMEKEPSRNHEALND